MPRAPARPDSPPAQGSAAHQALTYSEVTDSKAPIMRFAPLLAVSITGLLFAGSVVAPASAAEAPIDLGTAATYSVLSSGAISNTGYSVIAGNVGANSAISGIAAASVSGVVHRSDGPVVQALADATAAYVDAASRPRDATVDGDLGGETLTSGTHYSAGAQTITGTLTFDAQGDPDAMFIVQVDGPLTTMPSTAMVLANGASASNIYWQVHENTTVGAGSTFMGTILGALVINLGAGSTVTGRALALGGEAAMNTAMVNAVWTTPQPAIAIAGGATRSTAAANVEIFGTATSEVGHTVVVTVGSALYSSLVAADGSWRVSLDGIANGDYSVTATVTDPGGTATAQQSVTVAVPAAVVPAPAPVVTIAGGPKAFTTDRTPKVAGTSTGSAGSSVVVKIGSKKKIAKVSARGTWSVVFAKLPYRTYSVTATITNAAVKQKLVVRKKIPPKITIAGGPADATDDRTPTIAGRTNAKVGTTVTVKLAGKTRSASVRPGKTWSVTFGKLPVGTFSAVVVVKNSAGRNTATQKLTIAPAEVVPVWNVGYLDQVVQGTTDAAVGTPVSVTVGILLYSTTVQAGGLWGVRFNSQVGIGSHTVAISAGGVTKRVTLVVASGAAASSLSFGCADLSPNGEAVLAFGGKTLTASVHEFGVWSVAPAKPSDCGYVIVPSVTDETASTGMFSRTPIAARATPIVTINGGERATDDPSIRDISGTSNAAVGSLVRIRMGNQTVETAVTPQHTWSFYRNGFPPGTYQLVVSVVDPTAGTGYGVQARTIG